MGGIAEILKLLPDFYPSKGASEKAVKKAETQLGVLFADEYRDYVRAYGNASANGHELTGISGSERINVVSVTMAERVRNPETPQGLYVVEQAHVDRIVVWQDSIGFIYQTIPGGMPQKIHENLSEYIAS